MSIVFITILGDADDYPGGRADGLGGKRDGRLIFSRQCPWAYISTPPSAS